MGFCCKCHRDFVSIFKKCPFCGDLLSNDDNVRSVIKEKSFWNYHDIWHFHDHCNTKVCRKCNAYYYNLDEKDFNVFNYCRKCGNKLEFTIIRDGRFSVDKPKRLLKEELSIFVEILRIAGKEVLSNNFWEMLGYDIPNDESVSFFYRFFNRDKYEKSKILYKFLFCTIVKAGMKSINVEMRSVEYYLNKNNKEISNKIWASCLLYYNVELFDAFKEQKLSTNDVVRLNNVLNKIYYIFLKMFSNLYINFDSEKYRYNICKYCETHFEEPADEKPVAYCPYCGNKILRV